jgi:NAD(P)-dependent dehydrogenase (short-subunit alcohol dehydrogenase family)
MSIPNLSLEGRAAIVTGAGSRMGIGSAIALSFAEAGADVAICDIVVEGGGMESLFNEIKQLGRSSLALQTDVTKKSDVDNLVKRVTDEFGFIDILVNCAGGGPPRPAFLEMPEEHWDTLMDVNCKSCFLCSQAVSKVMIERRKGSIINISSTGAQPRGGVSAYGAAKAAQNRLTAGLAHDLAEYNIRVNAIAPGMVRTGLLRHIFGDRWNEPEVIERAAEMIPLGYTAEPQDVANLALFLASDASRCITGVVITIDGGMSLVGRRRN